MVVNRIKCFFEFEEKDPVNKAKFTNQELVIESKLKRMQLNEFL
jgi:hypothetical protein